MSLLYKIFSKFVLNNDLQDQLDRIEKKLDKIPSKKDIKSMGRTLQNHEERLGNMSRMPSNFCTPIYYVVSKDKTSRDYYTGRALIGHEDCDERFPDDYNF
jgi:hypothetical protein